MPSYNKRTFFKNYNLHINENVYEPAEDTFLFAENLRVRDGAIVADIGTGCGILGILASKKAAKVIAIDVNPYAVRCAKQNAKLANVAEKMLFIQGSLFEPLSPKQLFDTILFNAPYLPSNETEGSQWIDRAWAGGFSGRKVIDEFISQASKHISSNCEILLMQSTLANAEATIKRFRKQGFKTDIVAKEDLPFFETILLIRAS
jgi:release factor glutamine methyltransferase